MYKALEFLKKLAKNFFSWGFFAIACSLTFCAVFFPSIFALGGLPTTTYTVTFSGDVDKVIIKKGDISVSENKDNNVEENSTVAYKITPKDKYAFKYGKTTVSNGTCIIREDEIIVTLSEVKGNQEIKISNVLRKYTVSFENGIKNNNVTRYDLDNVNISGKNISETNISETNENRHAGFSAEIIEGDDATYTITPKTGYTFKNKKGDKTTVDGGTVTYDYDNNKITVTLSSVTSAKTITISNVLKIYNISFENGGSNEDLDRVEIKNGNGGTISNNSDTVIEGDDATYTITPKTGYTFKEGKTTVTNGTYISNKEITVTLSNVNGNITITISDVLFAKFDVNFLYASDDDKVDKKLNILEIMTISQVTGETETKLDNSSEIGTDPVTYRFRLKPAYTQSYIKKGDTPISAKFHKKDGTTEEIVIGKKYISDRDYYECKLNISNEFTPENIGASVKITIGKIKKNRYKITINNTTGDDNNRVLSVNSKKLSINNPKDGTIEKTDILYGEEVDFEFKLDKEYEFVSSKEVKNLLGINYDDSNLALYFEENEGGNHPNVAKFSIEVTKNLEFTIGTNIYKEVSENINFENDTNIANELISYKYRVYLAEKIDDNGESKYKIGNKISQINPYRDAELLFELDKDYYDFDSNFQVNGNKCDDYTIDSKVYKLIKYKGYTDVQENPIVNLKFSGIEPVTHTVVFKGIFEKDEIDDSINVYEFEYCDGVKKDSRIEKVEGLSVEEVWNSPIKFKVKALGKNYTIDPEKESILVEDDGSNKIECDCVVEEFTDSDKTTGVEIAINNVSSNITISIPLERERSVLNFKKIEGAKFYEYDQNGEVNSKKEIYGSYAVPTNEDFYFAVKPETSYDLNSLQIKISNGTITEVKKVNEYKIYKLKEVSASGVISGTIEKLKYNVTLDKNIGLNSLECDYIQDGIKKASIEGVIYGERTYFEVQLPKECDQSKFKVYVNNVEGATGGTEIPLYNGQYIISDITCNKYVHIENVSINKYTVNLMESNGITYNVNGENSSKKVNFVEHGEEFKFKINASTGYKLDENLVVNCIGNSKSEALKYDRIEQGMYVYKISNITENFTIKVANVSDVKYTVTLEKVDGVTYVNDTGATISGKIQVGYGKNFEFSVNVADAYDDSIQGMYIIVNDGKTKLVANKLSSGRYIISNIMEDATIKVANIRKNSYEVSLVKTEGMDYYNLSNRMITGNNKVSHGENLTFKVKLYPAYEESVVKVMLGKNELEPDDSGNYVVENVQENKTVTVLGLEKTKEAEIINDVENLPDAIETLNDVDSVLEITKLYNSLPDEKKQKIANLNKLTDLQKQIGNMCHKNNDITVDGAEWYVKLMVVPISTSDEAYTRIYGKLNSEYILSLYDIYLWDMLTDKRYNLPKDQSIVVTLPTPDMSYFENATAIHEDSSTGKIDYLSLSYSGGYSKFEATSFSPMGIIANRTVSPGRSSLLDAVDANFKMISNYASSSSDRNTSNNGHNSSQEYNDIGGNGDKDSSKFDDANSGGNISETFKSRNNRVTAQGSAIRLILVLIVAILLAFAIWFIYMSRRRKDDKETEE